MHDVVAHRVSLIVVHAGALEVNAVDARTAEVAALIRTTGRQALTDLRAVLGALGQPDAGLDPQPMLSNMNTLLEHSRAAGVPVRSYTDGHERPLSATVDSAVYRVVQEALTNVHKHAGNARTLVRLRYLPAAVEVTIANEAPATTPPQPPASGLGLAGLRERVHLVGGRFEAETTTDGGFRVHAHLPAEPA